MRLGPPGPELRRYTAEFESSLPKRWRISNKTNLIQSVAEAQVVFGGDFHAYSQAQRTHLRLVRELRRTYPQKSFILACEFLEQRHQKWVDELLASRLSEEEFLRITDWATQWPFSWEAYWPLLQFARDQRVPVLALNRSGKLKSRDQAAAKRLGLSLKENPETLHYVIFGELHLADSHLPGKFQAEMKRLSPRFRAKTVIIYQDQEEIYFKLARRGLENQVEVLAAAKNKFCVLGSPPWVRWQSYDMYLEHTFDRDLDDGDAPLELSDQCWAMTRLLALDLGVSVGRDLSAYSSRERQLLAVLKSRLNGCEFEIARLLVEADRSFFIPKQNIGYIARPSVNHVADIAGRYVHAQLSSQTKLSWQMPDDFERLIWIEAIGFFSSKLINHKRSADTLTDLQVRVGELPRSRQTQTREILALALNQRAREVFDLRRRATLKHKNYRPRHRQSYFEAARLLGSQLGERLYQNYRRNWISKPVLLGWMKHDLQSEDFAHFYLSVLERLDLEGLNT